MANGRVHVEVPSHEGDRTEEWYHLCGGSDSATFILSLHGCILYVCEDMCQRIHAQVEMSEMC